MKGKINRFKYICKKSSEINKEEIKNYIIVFNKVFNLNYNSDWFIWKYINNIYGDSYIVMVYNNKGEVIAIRSFWRNDICNAIKSFQPVDTGVVKEYRKMGIFTQMNKMVLENIRNELIYNFPNSNSLPGYLKLGWKLKCKYNLHIGFNLIKILYLDYLKKIDNEYLVWRFINNPVKKYFYINRKGMYFLLSYKKYNIYYILGTFDEKYKKYFNKTTFPIIFYYSISKNRIAFLNNKCNLVIKNAKAKENMDVPIFRGDVI